MYPNEVIKALKGLRQERGITAQELSNRTGINRVYLSRLEKGNINITLRTLKTILSCGYNMKLKEFFNRYEN